jgi:REP element-mobilizing transposase RayT
MTRPLRLEFPGALFHVFARGNAKQCIFLDDNDRERFIGLLGRSVERFGWIVPAYVLMPNHYHALVQLTSETLSRGMHWLNGSYSVYFNERHQRVGHLFQGRFKAPLIEKQVYFLEVSRYTVLNPVRAKLAKRPEDYRWSSHRAVLGLEEAPRWLAVDDVLANFGTERQAARDHYRAFVDAGVGLERSPWNDLVAGSYLGSEKWLGEIRERVKLKPRCDEHPSREREVRFRTMPEIVGAVAASLSIDSERVQSGRLPRMVAAWCASNEALLTHREIAAGLRMRSVGHVSSLVRECERQLDTDAALRKVIEGVRSTMSGKKQEKKT